jgi:hypothetical protein
MKYLLALVLLASNTLYASDLLTLDCSPSNEEDKEERVPFEYILDPENEKAYVLKEGKKIDNELIVSDFFYIIGLNKIFDSEKVEVTINRKSATFKMEYKYKYKSDSYVITGNCKIAGYTPKV